MGPPTLLELDGWRILTDPTFDPPGRRYGFGWGTSSTKATGPALDAGRALGPIDVVLLSHDHHADNLDDLPGVRSCPGAGTRAHHAGPVPDDCRPPTSADCGSAGSHHPGQLPGRASLTVDGHSLSAWTASQPSHRGRGHRVRAQAATTRRPVAVWMTGDTVLHRPLRRLVRTLDVDVLLLHLGSVQFPVTGPLRYSMDSADALELVDLLGPRVAVPVHYEGWSHFREPQEHLRAAVDRAAPDVRNLFTWLDPGVATVV